MPNVAIDWNVMRLRKGTRDPGTFRVGDGGGAAVLTGFVDYADLQTVLSGAIESAAADNVTGIIRRTVPVGHPDYPWLYMKDVTNAQGIGFVQKVTAPATGALEAPCMPNTTEYTTYEVQATFEPRPYAVLPDKSIQPYTINYYGTDGSSLTKSAYREWWRYTEWLMKPAAEFLTADKGALQFAAPGGGANKTSPGDGSSGGVGQIRFLLSKNTWMLNWYKVPYNYVLSSNSYFTRYVGHVNQQAWEGFNPGCGLLLAVDVLRVYSPPFPDYTPFGGSNIISQDKLCDLQFVIEEVNRTPDIAVTPTNASHIAAGHNCVLYSPNMKFYYAESFRLPGGSAGTGRPIYNSVPFDLLFQNPDGPP